MVHDKRVTFRVRRIPPSVLNSDVSAYLLRCFGEDFERSAQIYVRSLAPSPDDWDAPPRQIGTVEFSEVPHPFKQPGQTQWTISHPVSGDDLLFDIDFLGFTPLNAVGTANHVCDCVAVSGLASHAFGSWRQRDHEVTGPQFMWLRDQLPHDLPGLRVMTYGYNTDLVGSESVQNIDDLARTFILDLKTIGRARPSAKPLIILAHSLGGIVIKRAMLYLANSSEVEDYMLGKCNMAILFGTPNRGMEINHLRAMVNEQPNEGLLHTLCTGSPYLHSVDDSFFGIAQKRALRIISVFETKRSPTAQLMTSGVWQRTGAPELLVSRESAIQRASRDPMDIVPINQNHSDIVKFARNEASYSIIRGYIREALESDTTQFRQSQNIDQVQLGVDGNQITGRRHGYAPISDLEMLSIRSDKNPAYELLGPEQRTRLHNFWGKSKLTFRSGILLMQIALKKSIAFPQAGLRLKLIENAHPATFGWIYENQDLGFLDWILDGTGLYWIRGKPGSGKSTLMKFLYKDDSFHDTLSSTMSKTSRSIVDLWFFFNARGGYQETTIDGLLRTVLLQIVESDAHLALTMLKAFEAEGGRWFAGEKSWTLERLESYFQAVLNQQQIDIDLILFLDALDEYQGFPKLIVRWLTSLTENANHSGRRTRVKICFSSREWDEFVKAFDHERGFKLHEHTFDDVRQYTMSRVTEISSSLKKASISAGQHDDQVPLDVLANLVARKAEGVFLWVSFALDDLLRTPLPRKITEIEDLVNKLPDKLEVFYISTLGRIPQHSRYRAFTLLEIVLRSPHSLKVADLFVASGCCHEPTYMDCLKSYQLQKKRYIESSVNPAVELINLCGGLLECRQQMLRDRSPEVDADQTLAWDSMYVQFIHKTVKDFVGSPGFAEYLFGSGYDIQSENGYSWLLKFFIVRTDPPELSELALLAHRSEKTLGRPATAFLDSIPDSVLGKHLFPKAQRFNTYFDALLSGHLIFALHAGLNLYLPMVMGTLKPPRKVSANCPKPLHAITLWCNVRHRETETSNPWSCDTSYPEHFAALATAGFSIGKPRERPNAWDLLFENTFGGRLTHGQQSFSDDMLALATTMLEHCGHSPDAELSLWGESPRLRCAIHCSTEDQPMLELLLGRGADPDALDHDGRTALDHCVCGVQLGWTHGKTIDTMRPALTLIRSGGHITPSSSSYWPQFWNDLTQYCRQNDQEIPTLTKPPILPSAEDEDKSLEQPPIIAKSPSTATTDTEASGSTLRDSHSSKLGRFFSRKLRHESRISSIRSPKPQ